MTQLVGYALIALIVAALLFYAVIAMLPEGLAIHPERDDIPSELPSNRLVNRDDLVAVRLPVVLRGYRMADTDDLLDRLTLEIAVRDRELEQLRAVPPAAASDSEAPESRASESLASESPASGALGPDADVSAQPEATGGAVRPYE